MKRFFAIAIVFPVLQSHAQKTYYVTPGGNDANGGTSITKAFKTIAKINSLVLQPGDKVLFQGGHTFSGTIELDSLDGGSPAKPVVISSFGTGRANIDAGKANGFTCNNCSHIKISRLHLKGNGVEANAGSGILFNSNRVDKNCKNIQIDNCLVEGFHDFGILINCADGEAVKGFDSVAISNCTATANGEAGIGSLGGQTAFHHTHIRVTHCTAYLNKGIHNKTEGHSGNGIVMSSVQHLLIDNCLAYENGALNNCNAGGPVGIWMWICKDAVIEHCESHHNHAGLTKDGGGFDIDGGCSNCIIQYNYSHDNEGAGYLLAEYGSGMPFTNNMVRFNISRNDGRKNGYGGIGFWGVSGAYRVTNTYVYNNTVYCNDSNLVDGVPAAVMTMGNYFSHILVANNVFVAGRAGRLLNSDAALDTAVIYFVGNDWYGTNNKLIFNYQNVLMHSLSTWLAADADQETYKGKAVAISLAPNYSWNMAAAGKSGKHGAGSAAFHLLHGKKAYTGMDIKKAFGIDCGGRDFYGANLNKKDHNLVGAVLE